MICPDPLGGFQLSGGADMDRPTVRGALTMTLAAVVTRWFNTLVLMVDESTKASSNERLPAVDRLGRPMGGVVAMPRILHPELS